MTPLWDRLTEAKQNLAPVRSRYRVLFEDPSQPDAPAVVIQPDPHWLAAAMAGGVLPPVETYLDGTHPYADPIGSLTEEQAVEYLIQKDVPPAVWRDYRGNRTVLRIVTVEQIPTDRVFRDAWRVAQTMEVAA